MVIGVWSLVAISYQSFLFTILGWLTLGCHLAPHAEELHEVTLMKLLYLYDPVACGRIHFYNFTTFQSNTNTRLTTAVIWPISNDVAFRFRSKIQVWLTIHLIWVILAVTYISLGNRPCAFYVALLPFTATGVSLLIVDLVFTCLFIDDSKYTGTETDILRFINNNKGYLRSVNTTINVSAEQDTINVSAEQDTINVSAEQDTINVSAEQDTINVSAEQDTINVSAEQDTINVSAEQDTINVSAEQDTINVSAEQDTSWISLLMAYVSCRGVVQWIFNFWIVKDTYFEGVAVYHNLQYQSKKAKGSQHQHHIEV